MNERIKKIRKDFEMTQSEFANKLKISQNSVARLESGDRNPSDQTLYLICKQFNVNEEWLRYGVGEVYVGKTTEDDLTEFFAEVLADEDDSFRRRFVHALSGYSDDEWFMLGRVIDKFIDELKKEED